MSRYSEADDGSYTYKKELHTRYVTPRVLQRELQRLLGTSQWQVEMRHNVYNIKSCTNFDVKDLISNCQQGTASPRTYSSQNLTDRGLNNAIPRRLPDTPKIHLVTVKAAEVAVHDVAEPEAVNVDEEQRVLALEANQSS